MNRTVSLSTITLLALVLLTRHGVAQAGGILQATLAEPNQKQRRSAPSKSGASSSMALL
jgi:hypothetical protein